jgi:Kef-type K+ transport system membrane component KefB
MAVALTAQSPAVVMAMVSETRADGPLTQVMLASVIVADLLVIVLFAVASALAVAAVGGGVDFRETALAVAWELIGSMVFGIAVGMVLGIFVRTVQRGAALFTVMICIVVAEIGTRIHLDPLICMLSAGLWLENFSKADAHKLIADFESAQLPVFLVFFALAGAKLDIGALIASVIPVAVLALVRGFTFFTASTIACKQTGAEPVVRKFAWFGLVPQAGLALALALLIQKTFPTFGNEAAVIVFGVVAVNELIAPVILRALLLRSGEAGKREATDFVPH